MYINREGLQFSRRDTFDYTTLGDLMIRWLEQFKEHGKHRCNSAYLPERSNGDYTDQEIETGIQAFYKDIDDLIWALDDDNEPYWEDADDMERGYDEYQKERREKLEVFAKIYQMLWR